MTTQDRIRVATEKILAMDAIDGGQEWTRGPVVLATTCAVSLLAAIEAEDWDMVAETYVMLHQSIQGSRRR